MKKGTGKFVTPEEMHFVTQLFGKVVSSVDEKNKITDLKSRDDLNNFMKMLAMKYDYPYEDHEINPQTGEVIHNCWDCPEELKAEDVSVEE